MVAPITSTARGLATEVAVGSAEGVRDGSVANLDNTMLLHRSALGRKCGQIDESRWPEFCKAIHKMMGCRIRSVDLFSSTPNLATTTDQHETAATRASNLG